MMAEQPTPGAKLRMAMELYDFAEQVQLQNLRRRFSGESEEQIRARLKRWLEKRDEPVELPIGFRVRD